MLALGNTKDRGHADAIVLGAACRMIPGWGVRRLYRPIPGTTRVSRQKDRWIARNEWQIDDPAFAPL